MKIFRNTLVRLRYMRIRMVVDYRHAGALKRTFARFFSSGMMEFNVRSLVVGGGIGMFWAFIVMPFQMIPAAICCYFLRGNLPLAVLLVWLSNPLTYVPILVFEYQVGALLLQREAAALPLLHEYSDNIAFIFQQVGSMLFVGMMVTALTMTLAGFVIGYVLSKYLRRAYIQHFIHRIGDRRRQSIEISFPDRRRTMRRAADRLA